MTTTARYVLRSFLSGVSAAASSLLTALPGISMDELMQAGLLGVLFGLGYAGIGAASQNIEPAIGRKPSENT